MKKANAVPQNKKTKTGYERYLNTFDIPEQYLKSHGGSIPDRCKKYGCWLRRKDPIAFNVGYNEHVGR